MSLVAISWVFKQEIKPSSLKFVLVALADCADDKGICWPSIDHIVETTCQDRKTVIKSLDDLESRGWLVDTGKRMGRTNQVKVYRLTDAFFGTKSTSPCEKSAENGTLSKESQISVERVPFFRGKSTENGIPPTPPYRADPSIEPSLDPPVARGTTFYQTCFDYITASFQSLAAKNSASIHAWEAAGYDFQRHVRPAVDSAKASNAEPRSFNFFTGAISDSARIRVPPAKVRSTLPTRELSPDELERQRQWHLKMGLQHPLYNPEGIREVR